jgi:polysaccharide biosynthesis transport protein
MITLCDDNLLGSGQNGHTPPTVYEPPTTSAHSPMGEQEFNWERFIRILQKHFLISISFALIVAGAVAAVTIRMKDVYEATSRLEVQPMGLDSFSSQDRGTALEVTPDYLETQAQILKSDELALAVVTTLHLDQDSLIVGQGGKDPIAIPLQRTSRADSLPPPTAVASQVSRATRIEQIQVSRSRQQVRLSVHGNGQLTYEIEHLDNPERLVLDLPGTELHVTSQAVKDVRPVRAVRTSQYKPDVTRVVIELDQPATYEVSPQMSDVILTVDVPTLSANLATARKPTRMHDRTAAGEAATNVPGEPETKPSVSSTADVIEQRSQEPLQGAHRTRRENAALRWVQRNLTVTPVRDSRLIEVSFASYDPQLSALICNTLVNLFIERTYKNRSEDTSRASEWLSRQLADLREKLEKSQQDLAAFQNTNGIVDIDEKQNAVTQKVADLNHQVTQAQADRIESEAYLKLAEVGNTQSLPQIRENQLFQTLTQRFADDRSQLAEALAIYGEKNSRVIRLQSQVNEMQSQLTAQQKRVVEEFKTSYQTARAREVLYSQSLMQMKSIIQDANEKMIRYNFLKKQTQVNEDLYNTLFARLKEAGISAGLRTTAIRVVDQAPVLDTPTAPHRLLNIAVGVMLGVFGGIALAFVRESLDKTLRSPHDVRKWTGRSAVGVIPLIPSGSDNGHKLHFSARSYRILHSNGKNGHVAATLNFFVQRPRSAESEAVRRLHASIKMSQTESVPRVILIASPSPKEGKTTVAVNLAMALAHHGKTCLLDADMRKLAITYAFGLSSSRGLVQALEDPASLERVLFLGEKVTKAFAVPGVQNLSILPVGPKPSDPGELIASNTMRQVVQGLRNRFDYVVIDSPALIPYADARILAPLADGVILVGLFGSTTYEGIMQSTEILEQIHANLLGVVLNGVDLGSPDYHFYRYE